MFHQAVIYTLTPATNIRVTIALRNTALAVPYLGATHPAPSKTVYSYQKQ